MKKIIFSAAFAILAIACVWAMPSESQQQEQQEAETLTAFSLSETNGATLEYIEPEPLEARQLIRIEKPQTVESEEALPEYVSTNIPLSTDEQTTLHDICEEYSIPYPLALALIEQETGFRNVVGDDGASIGYMQIQQRWHWDRMESLGVTNLLDPEGNFRVGCDFLSELYSKYNDWGITLTVYNAGYYPGYYTSYTHSVLDKYAAWQETLDIHE